jgi:hypothetical protein
MFMRVWRIFYPLLGVLLRWSTSTGRGWKNYLKRKIPGCIFTGKFVVTLMPCKPKLQGRLVTFKGF